MRRWAMLVSAVSVSACGKAEYPGPLLPPPTRDAALTAVDGCDDLAAAVRKHIAQEMERHLEESARAAYEVRCSSFWDAFSFGGMADDVAYAPAIERGGGSPSAYTTTNVQVAGVDEPDLVKNDAMHIYLISGDELLILASWPAAETRVVGRVTIAGTPRKLFVRDGRAVVYADEHLACSTYDYYGQPSRDGDTTLVHVFDIADATHPKRVRTIRAEGHFVAARMVDRAVHTVLSFTPTDVTYNMPTWVSEDACHNTADEITAAFLRLREQNLATIAGLDISARLPVITSERITEQGATLGTDLYASCANLYDPSYTGTPDLVTLLSFPIDDDEALSGTGILGGSGEVYADADTLYVATSSTLSRGSDYWSTRSSVIHELAIDAGAGPAVYVASGAIDGVLLRR